MFALRGYNLRLRSRAARARVRSGRALRDRGAVDLPGQVAQPRPGVTIRDVGYIVPKLGGIILGQQIAPRNAQKLRAS